MATTDLRSERLTAPIAAGAKMLVRSDQGVHAALQRYEDERPSRGRAIRIRRQRAVVTATIDWLPAAPESLGDHLSRQARLQFLPSRARKLVEWVIGNLDADGYLREDLGGLADAVGAQVTEIEHALATVQSLEPVGVGARSLRECLRVQLSKQDDPDRVAVQLVESHMQLLAEKRYAELARALHQPVDRVMQAVAAIRRLEPRPGRPFGDVPAQTIRPDAAIVRTADDYRAILSDDGLSDVRVSTYDWRRAATQVGEARRYAAQDLRTATWLVTALDRRRHTVRGILHSIIRHQRDFLEHGPRRLRALGFRQVSQEVGVHETTVSRAVAHRYVATPHGVFPLRYFFSNRLPADPAGVISPVAARQRIRELVEAEDPMCPLTDRDIVEALAATGIRIARRTVAKYREQLGITRAPARRAATA